MAETRSSLRQSNRKRLKIPPPIQTSFGDALLNQPWTFSLSTAPVTEITSPTAPAAPPHPDSRLERRQSKLSLFDLFSRPKVERARGYAEHGLPSLPETPLSPTSSVATPRSSIPQRRPDIVAPPRPKTLAPQRGSTAQQEPAVLTRKTSNWDPPPLFQAYPQAIKYDTLQASGLTVEAIVRAHSHKRQYSLLQGTVGSAVDVSMVKGAVSEKDPKKQERTRFGSKRFSSANGPEPLELVQKIYVLVTAGYVLQYARDGPSDRMPEKVLQLGQDSAAFASDLIPGKHWVLQISQSMGDDGLVNTNPTKSLLSRLRIPTAGLKKSTTSFLLVLQSAEEMQSWLKAVRNVIDSASGRQRRPEVGVRQRTDDSMDKKLREQPSHRFLVQRDPSRFDSERVSSSPPPQSPLDSPTIVAPDWEGSSNRIRSTASDAASLSSSRHQSVRQSTEASSFATTTISNDQLRLDHLRDGSRHSFMSSRTSGTAVTATTSRCSSPVPPSPRPDSFTKPDPDPLRNPATLKSSYMNPAAAVNPRRRSMQTLPPTREIAIPEERPGKPYRHSTQSSISRTEPQGNSPSATPPTQRELSSTSINNSPVKQIVTSRSSSASLLTKTLPPSPILETASAAAAAASHRPPDPHRKPAFRPIPLPVRPSDQPLALPRRLSSLPHLSGAAASFTTTVATTPPAPTTPSLAATSPLTPKLSSSSFSSAYASHMQVHTQMQMQMQMQHPHAYAQHSTTTNNPLRRPSSLQIRSDPAPFLSSYRGVRVGAGPSARSASAAGMRSSSSSSATAVPLKRPLARVRSSERWGAGIGVSMVGGVALADGLPPPSAPPPSTPLPVVPVG